MQETQSSHSEHKRYTSNYPTLDAWCGNAEGSDAGKVGKKEKKGVTTSQRNGLSYRSGGRTTGSAEESVLESDSPGEDQSMWPLQVNTDLKAHSQSINQSTLTWRRIIHQHWLEGIKSINQLITCSPLSKSPSWWKNVVGKRGRGQSAARRWGHAWNIWRARLGLSHEENLFMWLLRIMTHESYYHALNHSMQRLSILERFIRLRTMEEERKGEESEVDSLIMMMDVPLEELKDQAGPK